MLRQPNGLDVGIEYVHTSKYASLCGHDPVTFVVGRGSHFDKSPCFRETRANAFFICSSGIKNYLNNYLISIKRYEFYPKIIFCK